MKKSSIEEVPSRRIIVVIIVVVAAKFSSLTDLYNNGAAADVLNVVDFSRKEPQCGAPILSQRTTLRADNIGTPYCGSLCEKSTTLRTCVGCGAVVVEIRERRKFGGAQEMGRTPSNPAVYMNMTSGGS